MTNAIPVPSKGSPLLASWGASVANGINSMSSMSSPGMMCRDGFTGTGAEPLPKNLRDRKTSREETSPRQFTLRATVETQGDGDSRQYRVKVDYYNVLTVDAVTYSGMALAGPDNLSRWQNVLTTEWASSLSLSATYYLNVELSLEWEGGVSFRVIGNNNENRKWYVSNSQVTSARSNVGPLTYFKNAYPIGKVSATGSTATVEQYFDGPLNFLDTSLSFGDLGAAGEDEKAGSKYPSAFQYKRTDSTDGNGNVLSSSWSIVNNVFYWDGELKTLSDFNPSSTGTVYLVATQQAPTAGSPNPAWTFGLSMAAGTEPSGGKVMNFKLYDLVSNEVTLDYRTTFLSLVSGGGGVKSITGDAEGSETIKGEVEISGKLDPDDDDTSSGIEFLTVSAREADGDDPARPPRIIAKIKGQDLTDQNESDWGAHEITYTDSEGNLVTAHVFSCSDIEIGSGDGGDGSEHDISNVIGSDYIEVSDEQEGSGDEAVTKRQVKAYVKTGVAQGENADQHALLTHDTEQKVLAKKIFQDAAGTKLVTLDGPNGSITLSVPTANKSITINAAGEKPSLALTDGTKTISLSVGDIPQDCQGPIKIHSFKFKDSDGNTHTYHGLFCGDIDISESFGKTIDDVDIVPVAGTPTGKSVTFKYTDGSSDEFVVHDGLKGDKGDDGDDGETPEIDAVRNGNKVFILADGEQIATLTDGRTPVITAAKAGKITTIFADGQAIATINDGEDGEGSGEWVCQSVITGVRFQTSNGKIQAVLSKSDIWVPNWQGKVPIEYEDIETVDVCDVSEIDVVTSESYSTSTHQFTNVRKTIQVIGAPDDAQGQTPFTATPHSSE